MRWDRSGALLPVALKGPEAAELRTRASSGGRNSPAVALRWGMDIYAALEEVTRWCAKQTAAGDPEHIEVDCHATVWITIGENAPPWHVRRELSCSSGAGSPVAQLRYDLEKEEWALHHGERSPAGWCGDEDAVPATEIGPLLELIETDASRRYEGLPPGFRWPWADRSGRELSDT